MRSADYTTARRELGGVLVPAINSAHGEGILRETRKIPLPPTRPPRDKALTRKELAWLLRASRDKWITKKSTGERKLIEERSHLRRFILTSYRMGRRMGAVLDLKWKEGPGGGWADLKRGIAHFEDPARPITKKLRGSAKMPPILVSFMRRWKRLGGEWVIEYKGKKVAEIDTAFEAACRRAEKMHAAWKKHTGSSEEALDLSDVTVHVLKHTAVSWYFDDAGDLMPGTKFFATSSRTLETVYYNHHPEGQAAIAARMNRPGRGLAVPIRSETPANPGK
jgi:hypothetical protein